MQDFSIILALTLAVAAVMVAFVLFRVFKNRWRYKNGNVNRTEVSTHPTTGAVTQPTPQFGSSSGLANTLSVPESNMLAEQLENDENTITPSTMPSPSVTTVSTLAEQGTESKEEKTEDYKANIEEGAERNTTEITTIKLIESGSDLPMGSDNVASVKETNNTEITPSGSETLESIERTIENQEDRKDPTKEKGNFRGAPIGARDKIPKESSKTEEVYRRLKPEVVSWRREGKWIIGVEIPSDYFGKDIQEVLQSNNKMLREESRDECWRLESLADPLEVKWGNENNCNIDRVSISEQTHGIFKLTGSDEAQGRLVKRIAYGAYLLVVPSTWSFQQGVANHDTVEESISIENCKAYYCRFEKGKDGRITFVDDKGKLLPFEAKSPLFELIGTGLEDSNDDMGSLFGNGPPDVKIKGHRSWKEIACVVVIQQGIKTGEERFKDKIIPQEDVTQLSLGDNLQAQSSGWYSLRFYDNKQDAPIERLDFRFVSAISKIKIHQNSVLPTRSGHQNVTVEIAHEPNFRIELASPKNNSLQIKQGLNSTTIIISPKPEADESRWFLGIENGQYVPATFLAERIWWSISEDTIEPMEWYDEPVVLKREDFNPTAHKALWVHLPSSGWIDRIYVDFSSSLPRHFLIKRDQRAVKISLNNFYDSHAISNKNAAHDLFVQVRKDNHHLSAIVGTLHGEKIQVESPIQQPQGIVDARAAHNGGKLFYGNCRHCRAMLKEKNYGSH